MVQMRESAREGGSAALAHYDSVLDRLTGDGYSGDQATLLSRARQACHSVPGAGRES